MIKVMVVGQKWLAEQILLLCMDESYEVAAVAPPSHDDRLAKTAKGFDIPVRIAPKRLDAKDVPDDIDLILCAHTHCYIAAEARQKCKLGAIGFHPSLLPSYKGKNAIQDAINAGENETGGSIFLLDDGWDTGQVLFQQTCMISSQDTAQSLWINKLAPMALNMFRELLINLQVKEALPM